MSHEEADPLYDTIDKPVDVGAGEPQEPANPDLMAALGLSKKSSEKEEDPLKTPEAIAEGEKTAENLSKKIQEHSEELYENLSYRAKTEDGYLEKLLDSKDPIEKKNAKKILERNPEHFGAKTVEEYKLVRAKKQAGDDPAAQVRVDLDHKLSSTEQRVDKLEWETWKKEAGIKGDFGQLIDDLHSEHPDLDRKKLVAMAKGLHGNTPIVSKEGSSFASGASAPSKESDDVFNSPLAKRIHGSLCYLPRRVAGCRLLALSAYHSTWSLCR